ncbi:hypothetical protein CPB97_006116 [Podila verticillata]|nr:hypothetical protein CPB97_006116 [Podila verticillata]
MLPQIRLSLEDIKEIETKRAATLQELHSAIVQEVRNANNWDNAWTLFSDYLCPAIVLGQERQQQQEQGHGRLQGPTESDIRMIQFSISVMVRYAPTTAESNAVYVFFLQQCRPPIRDDQTINNCLVSLIYQYAQAKDPEIQRSGLDLVKIALDRGVGLPTYSAHSNSHDHPKHHRFSAENARKEHILVSVSKRILMLHQLQISADGTTLEPITTGGGRSGRERGRPSDGGTHQRSNTNNSTSSSSSPRKSNKGDSPPSPKASNNNGDKAEGKHKEPKEGGEPKEVKDTKEPKEKKRDAKASNNKDKDNKVSTQQQPAPRKSKQPKLRQEGESALTDASSSTTAAGASSTPSSPSSPNTRAHNGRNSKAENNAHSSNDKSPQQKTQENNKKSSRPNSPPKASGKKDKEDKKEKEPRFGPRSGGGGGRAAFAGAERNRNSRDTPSSSGGSSPRQILFVPASTNHLLKSGIDSTATSSLSTSAAADAAIAAAGSASTSLSSTTTPKRSQSIRRGGAKKARESVDAKEGKDKEPSTTGSLANDMEKLKLDSAPVQA